MSIYDIILKARVTSKATTMKQRSGQFVLDVHPKANKPMIREALRKLFNVEVEKIRVIVTKGKLRRSGRHFSRDKKRKKAIVKPKEGSSLDLISLGGVSTQIMESK